MANVKFVAVSRGLRGSVDYVTNREKTTDKYISGVNCVAETAIHEFECVKKQFHKTDGRSYYHIVQAFSPDDPVDFETVHKIGLELAAYFKGYQCIVATHMNTAHKHNHIIMNSVNYETGAKFHQSAKEMKLVKEFNNQLCKKYGLSVTEAKADPFKIPKWKTELKNTIRSAMEHCNTREQFIDFMRGHNYDVKWEPNQKYITYTTPENIRCRDNKLFDQTLLRGNMELYFAMGGAEYHLQQQNAKAYGGAPPSLDDTIFSTAAVMDAWLSDDGDKFHLETLHRSNKEIEKLARLGRKIEQIVYAVKDDDESRDIDNAKALYQASLILGDWLYEERKRRQKYDKYEDHDPEEENLIENEAVQTQYNYYDFDEKEIDEEVEEEMDEEYEQYHGFGGMTMGGM